jgi:hypothetical protein
MLVLCIFLSWYVTSFQTSNGVDTYSANFYPGQTVTVNSASGSSSTTYSTTYQAADLNNTGGLYSLVEILLVVGTLLGVIGGILILVARNKLPSLAAVAVVLVVFAAGMAIVCPLLTLLHQPAALSADTYVAGSGSPNSTGPTTSFFGSTSTSGGTGSWGPGLGWYLSILMFGLLAVSAGLAESSRGAEQPQPGNQAPSLPPAPAPAAQAPAPETRFCPACGMGNLRRDVYCQKCGRVLPPPP